MQGICIIGNDGAGKTTTANLISNLYPNTKVVSFASALKDDLNLLRLPVHQKPYSTELRAFIRSYGDLQRQLNSDTYWVERLFSSLESCSSSVNSHSSSPIVQFATIPSSIQPEEWLVVDDMRYWSELNAWTNKFKTNTRIITLGSIQDTTNAIGQSVIEVNQLLTTLRKDTTRNMLHIPNNKEITKEELTNLISNYLSNNK